MTPVTLTPGPNRPNHRSACLATLMVMGCCDMLGVVGSNLRMVKFFMQHLWMLHELWSCGGTNLVPRAHMSFGQHQDMELLHNQFPEL